MTRRTEVTKLDEGWVIKAWAKTEAEAARLQFALVGVPPELPNVGTTMPKPEEESWPSDRTATNYPPNCDGLNCAEALTERTAGDD